MPENPYQSPEAERIATKQSPVRVFRTTIYGAGSGFIFGLVQGTLLWTWVVLSDGSFWDFADYLEDARDQTIFYDAPICALLGLVAGFVVGVSRKILRRLTAATH